MFPRTQRSYGQTDMAIDRLASDPDQEYIYFIGSKTLCDPDQEYIYFMWSDTLPSALTYFPII